MKNFTFFILKIMHMKVTLLRQRFLNFYGPRPSFQRVNSPDLSNAHLYRRSSNKKYRFTVCKMLSYFNWGEGEG